MDRRCMLGLLLCTPKGVPFCSPLEYVDDISVNKQRRGNNGEKM